MPSPKNPTTGDSDDLGVGTVLMAVCVRCSYLCLNVEWL